MLAAQQSSTAAFQTSLLASVASQLEAFSTAQAQTLRTDVDLVRSDLESDASWRAQRASDMARAQGGAVETLRTAVAELDTSQSTLAADAVRHSEVRSTATQSTC